MPLFRKAAPRDPLIVSMTGAALGSRVLILCARDDRLPVAVAAKVGLSGQAVALAPDTSGAEAIGRRAARRGVFVERDVIALPLPCGDHAFDLVIADDRPGPVGARTDPTLLVEAFRVLRPGGRVVVLRPVRRWPWPRRSPDADADAAAGLRQALLAAGFRAAREIGAREGIRFVEAVRA